MTAQRCTRVSRTKRSRCRRCREPAAGCDRGSLAADTPEPVGKFHRDVSQRFQPSAMNCQPAATTSSNSPDRTVHLDAALDRQPAGVAVAVDRDRRLTESWVWRLDSQLHRDRSARRAWRHPARPRVGIEFADHSPDCDGLVDDLSHVRAALCAIRSRGRSRREPGGDQVAATPAPRIAQPRAQCPARETAASGGRSLRREKFGPAATPAPTARGRCRPRGVQDARLSGVTPHGSISLHAAPSFPVSAETSSRRMNSKRRRPGPAVHGGRRLHRIAVLGDKGIPLRCHPSGW